MMDCLRLALGEERILGGKFPQEKRLDERHPSETEEEHGVRLYTQNRLGGEDNKRVEKSKTLNPNGFWECRYTVRGVAWHLGIHCPADKVCKIVSQGLAQSDPKYVDKIIFMLRHPREVAKSQENLFRHTPLADGELEKMGVVHSPEMFINVTFQAARWLKENSHIPVLLVRYDDLLADPDTQLARVKEFLGEGNFSRHPVEKKLYRSKAEEDVKSDLWEISESVYEKTLIGDYDGIINTCIKNSRKIRSGSLKFHCFRRGRQTCYAECKACKNDVTARENFKKDCIRNKGNWAVEPCLFECAYDHEATKYLTIEESIESNFWLTEDEKMLLKVVEEIKKESI